MTRYKACTLTDVAGDVWLDNFALTSDALRLATPAEWSVRKRTLRGGLRDGVDLIEVHNGALAYSILPTRGMGLWRGSYRGLLLGWNSPVAGPVHPKFVRPEERGGLGWLAAFDEWLCRCGLASNGPPGEDVVTDKEGRTSRTPLTLHGRIANLPAQWVELRVGLDAPHEISVVGRVVEASLFGPHLALTTTYTSAPGSNRLVVHDVVENLAAQPAEMQMLYHCNVGPPFVEAGSRAVAPVREVAPRDARAAEGVDTYDTFAGPVAGFREQVYYYDLLADPAGKTLALLYNAAADRGLALRWNRHELPCFSLWKNTAAVADGYVAGLEPGTNYPNFKTFERQKGRVRTLPPGGRWECTWGLEVHDAGPGVRKTLAEIVSLQSHAKAHIHRTPQESLAST